MTPYLSKTAFWDVDFDSLDPELNAVFIIEKVFNYGLSSDNKATMSYYGEERIKTEIVKGAYFKKKVFRFLCVIFDLEPEAFICYIRRQSQPLHWNY